MSAKQIAKLTVKLLGTSVGLAIALFLFSSVAFGHANSGKGSANVSFAHSAPMGHVVDTVSHNSYNNFNGNHNFNDGNQWNGNNFHSWTGCGNCYQNSNPCRWGCSFVHNNPCWHPCYFSNGNWHTCFNGCTVWFQGCQYRWWNGCWYRWHNGCWSPCHGLSFGQIWY